MYRPCWCVGAAGRRGKVPGRGLRRLGAGVGDLAEAMGDKGRRHAIGPSAGMARVAVLNGD